MENVCQCSSIIKIDQQIDKSKTKLKRNVAIFQFGKALFSSYQKSTAVYEWGNCDFVNTLSYNAVFLKQFVEYELILLVFGIFAYTKRYTEH